MPNWVQIRFTVKGTPQAVQAFREGIKQLDKDDADDKDGNSPVDFNRLIPMPESLKDTVATFGEHDGYAILMQKLAEPDWEQAWLKKHNITSMPEYVMYLIQMTPTLLEDGFKIYKNLRDHGYRNWYEWSLDNWGTKWNAHDAEIVQDVTNDEALAYFFSTAWSFPEPFFHELAKRFPDVTILGQADEEGGFFYNEFSIADGVYTSDWHDGYRTEGPYWSPELEEEFVVVPPTSDAGVVPLTHLTPNSVESLSLEESAKIMADDAIARAKDGQLV